MRINLNPTLLLPKNYAHLACFLSFFLCATAFTACVGQNSQTAISEEHQDDIQVILADDWEFYWNALLTPEELPQNPASEKVSLQDWTNFAASNAESLPAFGYATYRTTVTLPKERPHVSLYIPSIYAASKTWINGRLVSEIGKVGKTRAETLHRRFSQIIPLNTSDTRFEIVIQVANFYHHKGGIDKPLIIDNSQKLQNQKSKRIIADMTYMGSLSFIGVFFLLFFLLYWNKDKAVLYFAVLCLSLVYMSLSDRYAPFAEIFESISWIFLTKVEYISLFLAGLSSSLFFYTIFVKFVPKTYKKIIIYGFLILCTLTTFLPAPHFTRFVMPFLILMVINILYVFYIIIRALTSQRHESILMMTSMVLASLIFFSHIFIFLGESSNIIVYVNFGYIIVFLLLSMLLMTRFADSFHALEKAKVTAQAQQQEIATKSEELSNVNIELKENVRQLKNYNAELNSFNHIVSHDLKAPLVAMHSLVSFMEEELDLETNTEAATHFESLKGRISKMYALINGMLEYSKIARGKKTKETFSIQKLLEEIVLTLNPENLHEIHIPKEDIQIHTSKVELEHVLLNLISNAIKHCDKEKAIITISHTKIADMFTFSIRDNGPGIDAKYHSKIFDMFYQLKKGNIEESTGIGLTIVKKIVSGNKGKITIDSEAGNGTTITFTWKV
ncbi:sensor histidine kinase [Kordia periserrulae]|uniref:sensor histidine kinase n=1 Tax=Kordia periserrulae TaxID=701523 RepID=UPI0011B2610E|nr:sensor histidine kinase [Kordia periserrulae]